MMMNMMIEEDVSVGTSVSSSSRLGDGSSSSCSESSVRESHAMESNMLISRYLLSNGIGVESDWRSRDSITSLLYNRLYNICNNNHNHNHNKNNNQNNNNNEMVIRSRSSNGAFLHGSVEDALERTGNHPEKCQAIVRAFYAAASCLLSELQRQHVFQKRNKISNADDDDDEEESF